MKTNVFRIGNFINPSFLMKISSIGSDYVYCDFDGNEGDAWEFDENDIDPIPLSEDILSKIGFEYYIDDNYWQDEMGVKLWFDGTGYYHINSELITHIDHIHTLQNWYFANVKEELKIDNL